MGAEIPTGTCGKWVVITKYEKKQVILDDFRLFSQKDDYNSIIHLSTLWIIISRFLLLKESRL